jgi:hypothetical protein
MRFEYRGFSGGGFGVRAFELTRCYDATPTHTLTPSRTPTPTPKPSCAIDAFGVWSYRAPITHNPRNQFLNYSSTNNYKLDKRFVDNKGVTWYHIVGAYVDGQIDNITPLNHWIPSSSRIVFIASESWACNNGNGLPLDPAYAIPTHP